MNIEVSEYRYVDDVRIHDVVPNGLCPLGPVNYTHETSGDDSECAPLAGHEPSQPYTSVAEQPDGAYDIEWDKSTYPGLNRIQPNGTLQLTFWTRTRDNYQSNYEDSTPVLSRDSVSNAIDTAGADYTRCSGGGAPDCSEGGTPIYHQEAEGVDDTDVSGSGKSATGPVLEKTVAANYPASGDCNDLEAAEYGKAVALYGPGDMACWKLRIAFPQHLDTQSIDVFDILPNTIEYVAGSWQATPADTVPVGSFEESSDGRLHWTIGEAGDVDAGGQIFEVTLKSTVGSPLGHHSGDVEGNLLKFAYENTPGSSFALRDRTDFTLKMPELSLLKGVRQIDGGTVNGPNVDHKQVTGGDAVQYRVDVENKGNADAASSRVWDQLPSGISCADVEAGSISDGGECVTESGHDQIHWSGIPLAAGETKTLTYTVEIPTGVGPDQSFVNTVGVVEYTYTTNEGHTYHLVPENSTVKDSSAGEPNVKRAEDNSDVYTPAASIAKTRTTSVSEGGNSKGSQATIGETVEYTVTATIPKGTTVYDAALTDVLDTSRQAYVEGSLSGTLNGVALPTAGVSAAYSAGTISASFPSSFEAVSKNQVLVLHFSTTVLDVSANTRGKTLPNSATLGFEDQLGRHKSHSSSVSTTIVEPKILAGKADSAGGGRVHPGQLVGFTVTASNPGGSNVSTAHEATVVDTIPNGVEPVNGGGEPLADGAAAGPQGGIWDATARTITWTPSTTPALAAIAPHGTVSLEYTVRVDDPAVAGANFDNGVVEQIQSLGGAVEGVRTSSSSSASTSGDYESSASDTLLIELASVSKDVSPDPVTIGEDVVWHVHVTVPMNLQSFDTTVIDTVPDGFEVDGYGPATCLSGCPGADPAISTFAPSVQGDGTTEAAWFLGDLPAAGEDRVYDLALEGHLRDTYVHGGAKVRSGQTLVNRASVGSDRTDKVGPNPASVPSSFDDTVGPAEAASHVVEPKMKLDKSASAGPDVEAGQTLTYTVKATNEGNSAAYDMVVNDQPDSELTNVHLLAGAGYATHEWSAGDHHIQWTVPGPLAAGESITFTYEATVVGAASLHDGETIHNTASIAEYFGVPQAGREAHPSHVFREYSGPSDSVTLHVILPELAIVKTPDGGEAVAGTSSAFSIAVTNTGHAIAHEVTVDDTLPSGLHYTAGSATASPSAGFSETSPLHWKVATLAPGATVTITLPVAVDASVPDGTTLVNDATTQATDVPLPHSDEGSLHVRAEADVAVHKSDSPDPVAAGTNLSYTIVVENHGPSDAQNVVLTDPLPSPDLSFVSADAPCTHAGNAIACEFGALAAGASRTIHVVAKVDPDQPNGSTIHNTATATTTTTDTEPENNHDSADTEVVTRADVSIVKTAERSHYDGGETIVYTLLAHNGGPSTAREVTVHDPLPEAVTFASVTPGSPTCSEAAETVDCALGSLEPGESRTITIAATAKGEAPPPENGHEEHQITVEKGEPGFSIQAGATMTQEVSCANGGEMVDGSAHVIDVDQGQSLTDVHVVEADSVALGTYRFVVRNDTLGQAQMKLDYVCLPPSTEPAEGHSHSLIVGAPVTTSASGLAPGTYEFHLDSPLGFRAVAPGIDVTSGDAQIIRSEDDGQGGWDFTVQVTSGPAGFGLSIRPLKETTGMSDGHAHDLLFEHREVEAEVGPHEVRRQIRVECPVEYKGIVATYDLPPGVFMLGSTPEPIVRDFDVVNTTGSTAHIKLDLVCMRIVTGSDIDALEPVYNTATIATTTTDPNPANDESSAGVTISRKLGSAPSGEEGSGGGESGGSASGEGGGGESGGSGGGAKTGGEKKGKHSVTGPTGATPALHIGAATLAPSAKTVSALVGCAAGAACSGTLILSLPTGGSGAAKTSSVAGGSKAKAIGRARYRIAPGKWKTVRVKVPKRYRRLVRRAGWVGLKIVASDGSVLHRRVSVGKRTGHRRHHRAP